MIEEKKLLLKYLLKEYKQQRVSLKEFKTGKIIQIRSGLTCQINYNAPVNILQVVVYCEEPDYNIDNLLKQWFIAAFVDDNNKEIYNNNNLKVKRNGYMIYISGQGHIVTFDWAEPQLKKFARYLKTGSINGI